MADIIQLLPDSVANQIAAGEVIQRPASVLKELVENAVDAGATEIQIVIKDAGRTLIQVVDNGKGMSPTDARLSFERHATSKIRKADDLLSLHTMGFRGEALPSICAIAQVELRTMAKGETLGTRLIINGSKVELQEPDVCTQGCNFMVKNLFFNTPARRKFLKSDNVELGAIMREFERLALVNNGIRFTLNAGSRQLDLRPATFKQRIADLWKNNLNMQLLPIEIDTSLVKISGFISRPEFARRHNPLQYLIVNGRNMRHAYFHKTIVACYENFIAQDTQPNYFLKFEVDPQTIDVNIHPTKTEIKFEHEVAIRPILSAAVKAAIGKFATGPSIDFNEEVMPLDPAREGDFVKAPTIDADPTYNPFKISSGGGGYRTYSSEHAGIKANRDNWESLYTGFMNVDSVNPPRHESAPQLPIEKEPVTPLCIQCGNKYIVTPAVDGLMVIDQHRAHFKILYERYMAETRNKDAVMAMQKILFPEVIMLDDMQQSLLEEIKNDIAELGYELHPVGEGKWEITGVPASLSKENARDVVLKIIDSIADENNDYGKTATPEKDDLRRRVAMISARASAMRGGHALSTTEMEHLLSELFSLPDPAYTPTGSAVFRTLPMADLISLFT